MIVAFSWTIHSRSAVRISAPRLGMKTWIANGMPGPQCAEHDEDGERGSLARGAGARLGDGEARSDGEQQVLGLHRGQQHGQPGGSRRADAVKAGRPGRQLGLVVVARATPPLARGDEQQQDRDDDLHDADPVRWPAVVARVHAIADEQRDGRDSREPEHPPRHEARRVHTALRSGEHQCHGDDRQRAERHADTEREDFTDGPAHRVSLTMSHDVWRGLRKQATGSDTARHRPRASAFHRGSCTNQKAWRDRPRPPLRPRTDRTGSRVRRRRDGRQERQDVVSARIGA